MYIAIFANFGQLVPYGKVEGVDGVYPSGIIVLRHDILQVSPSRRVSGLQNTTLVIVGHVVQKEILNAYLEVSCIRIGLDVGVNGVVDGYQ